MIIFFENGRTGNQLFQYIGLKKYFPRDKLVFIGFKELFQYFDKIDAYFLNKNKLMNWFLFILPRSIFFFLANLRIIGSIIEYDHHLKESKVIVKKGFFSKIFIAKNIYFQQNDIIKKIQYPPLLKDYIHQKAFRWFQDKKINLNISSLVFVHVRRGDYIKWPNKKFPAILEFEWYDRAMSLIKTKLKNPIFIIMSDDQNYIHNFFKESKSLFISNNNLEIDLSIMSMCSSGILSASSFSWWGGYYAHSLNWPLEWDPNINDHSIFIGPNYWGGYRMRQWYPSNFKVNWITYLD